MSELRYNVVLCRVANKFAVIPHPKSSPGQGSGPLRRTLHEPVHQQRAQGDLSSTERPSLLFDGLHFGRAGETPAKWLVECELRIHSILSICSIPYSKKKIGKTTKLLLRVLLYYCRASSKEPPSKVKEHQQAQHHPYESDSQYKNRSSMS